jgi:hypothetical protein
MAVRVVGYFCNDFVFGGEGIPGIETSEIMSAHVCCEHTVVPRSLTSQAASVSPRKPL